ncbi:MAG: hypothetical protein NTW86_30490 [Candidatus Sumerlaeota bacterium]|nr:hypothetical protein [Candidatus Sumerlaeota bacterium]
MQSAPTENDFGATDEHFRLAALAAQFAEILRHSYWAKDIPMSQVASLLKDAFGATSADPQVRDLAQLVAKAQHLLEAQKPCEPAPAEERASGPRDTAPRIPMRP